MYNYEFIKKQINKYNYISFDMFDTLIKRNINVPTDLFQLIEEKYNIKNFKKIRIESEINARNKSNHKEPNINDIYKEINIKNKEKIKKIEIDLELKLCQQNIDFYNIYKYAKDKGKKIIITTDMYLEKTTINKILDNAGIEYDYLYLSNDTKLNKYNGKIYPYILNKLNINSKELLHIGDSKRADYLIPKFLGINSILIPKKINKLNYFKDYSPTTLDENIIINFINNNISLNKDIYYRIGYETLGILLLGFSEWLKENLQKEKINKIFFLAREGSLLKKAFDLVNDTNIKTEYLYVSRRSTRVSLLKNIKTLDEVFEICKMRRIIDLESFFANVGLNIDNYNDLLKKYNLKKESNIKNIVNFEEFFDEIKKDIIKNSKDEEKNLLSYLSYQKFENKLAISDVGWTGTMQNALYNIVKTANITGYYMGQNPFAKEFVENNQKQRAYLFDYKSDGFAELRTYMGLFESFFLANHGTTIRYKNNKPILAPYEFSNTESKIFKDIQLGAIDFIKELNYETNISVDIAFYGIKKLGSDPTLDDIKLFGKINYLDTFKSQFANPSSLFVYIFNPKKLYRDYCNCNWKTGFVKKLFKIRLPYSKILKKIYMK